IKVESRRYPDVIRYLGSGWLAKDRFGPEVWGDCGPAVSEFVTGKRSLGLDLKSPAAKPITKRLLERTDVFISNYSAPAVKALGLDYESVRAVRPDVIYASISGFGCDPATPYYDFVSWGPNQAPIIGLDDLTGWADRAPSGFSATAFPDYSNGAHATVAVLSAILRRDATGEGEFIELAQLEATAATLGPWFTDAQRGRAPRRDGNRVPGAAPHGVYPCRGTDRWVALAVFADEEWRALSAAAEHPEWAEDPRFATADARRANQDTLDEAIAAWTRASTDDAVAERLQRVGVAAAPVLDNARVALDPQLRSRSFWALAEHARFGADLVTGNPIALSGTPGAAGRAGPSFGQDNDYVLGEVCGYSREEIDSFVAARVVEPMASPGVELDRPYLSWIRHFMPELPWPKPRGRS
ncbi:MAG: CaiB/BaiF CoA transferase family protein, partial [Candidatus Binatia bacterium]